MKTMFRYQLHTKNPLIGQRIFFLIRSYFLLSALSFASLRSTKGYRLYQG